MSSWDIDVLQSELGQYIEDVDQARMILGELGIHTVDTLRRNKVRVFNCLGDVLSKRRVQACPSCGDVLPYDHPSQYCDHICTLHDAE